MGWVGLAAVLVPFPELGAGLGLVAEAAAGAEGAGVARAEEVVEDGVTAADWLRELGRAGQLQPPGAHACPAAAGPAPEAFMAQASGQHGNCEGTLPGTRPARLLLLVSPRRGLPAAPTGAGQARRGLTWRRSCWLEALRCPVSWPGRAPSGRPAPLQGARPRAQLSPPPPTVPRPAWRLRGVQGRWCRRARPQSSKCCPGVPGHGHQDPLGGSGRDTGSPGPRREPQVQVLRPPSASCARGTQRPLTGGQRHPHTLTQGHPSEPMRLRKETGASTRESCPRWGPPVLPHPPAHSRARAYPALRGRQAR